FDAVRRKKASVLQVLSQVATCQGAASRCREERAAKRVASISVNDVRDDAACRIFRRTRRGINDDFLHAAHACLPIAVAALPIQDARPQTVAEQTLVLGTSPMNSQ